MSHRIGELHLHYRSRAGAWGAALAPAIDRALGAGLGEALEARLSEALGDCPAVFVIRELRTLTRVGRHDSELDSRVVDKISRTTVDAVSAAIAAGDAPERLVRFADQAEFVGSFLLDLVDGTAWERWYYGAFQRYRNHDPKTVIASVLEDHRSSLEKVLAWLDRRGRLDALLAVIGPEVTRGSLFRDDPELESGALQDQDGLSPLLSAGFEILGALGWPALTASTRELLTRSYLSSSRVPPTWTDRRSLSAWVCGFVAFAYGELQPTLEPRERTPGALQALLSGPLDWLESAWLGPELERLASPTRPRKEPWAPPQVLTRRHEQRLERLADAVRRGDVRIRPTDSREAIVMRLLAALAEDAPSESPADRTLLATLTQIEAAFRTARERPLHPASRAGPTSDAAPNANTGASSRTSAAHEAVQRLGRAPLRVLRELLKANPARASDLVGTAGAGLFLLTRALLDVKLRALVLRTEVPFEPLLAALAQEWVDLSSPFDGPVAVWTGVERFDQHALEAAHAGLSELEQALANILVDQKALPADQEPSLKEPSLKCEISDATSGSVRRIASFIVRAFARWLPGIASSSPEFILQNCLRRQGRVAITAADISVELAPAPLDVVLEMAGYFHPIEGVPWLDNRRIVFRIQPKLGG